jgi:hypothetical protein
MAAEQDEYGLEQGLDATPKGQATRWAAEFKFARGKLKDWHRRGEAALKRFVDDRTASASDSSGGSESRLNIFSANVQTMRCIMYGKTPRVDVSRRFADSKDDVARVSAEVLERVLNADIQKDGDTYADAMGSVLDDRLVAGGGIPRVRYVADLEEEQQEPEVNDLPAFAAPPYQETSAQEAPPAMGEDGQPAPELDTQSPPATPDTEAPLRKTYECVEVDYVPWRHFLYGVGRTWADTRWVAFGGPLNRKEAEAQFGPDVAGRLPWDGGRKTGGKDKTGEAATQRKSPWQQVMVWEVWSREDKKRYFFCDGYGEVLVPLGQDAEPDGGVVDPYGLEGFFPCPKPFFANVTTEDFVPTPDFYLAQDLYLQIDNLFTRVRLLEDCIALRGIYDKTKAGVAQLLTQTGNMDNKLIPVDGAALMNGDGLEKWIQWLPLDMLVEALAQLKQALAQKIEQVDQVSGMSDIVRGEAAQQTTATEQSIKARFASVRIQAMQDEFARVCSDVQRLKSELISKHYDMETLLEAANMAYTPDSDTPGLVEAACQLIKQNHFAYRIEVKPESVSLADYAALKSESMEVLQGIGTFLQMAAPLGQMAPQLTPVLLQLLSWTVSRIRGSQEIEGLLDRAISDAQAAQQQAQANPQPQQPDPKVLQTQAKSQADSQHQQLELQADLARTHAEAQASIHTEAAKAQIGVAADAARQRNQSLSALNSALSPGGAGGNV